MPLPPEPIVTRWGSWLRACTYLCDNFDAVRSVVETFKDTDAEAIRVAKKIFSLPSVQRELAFIKNNFSNIADTTKKLEAQGTELKDNLEMMKTVENNLSAMRKREFHNKFVSVMHRNPGFETLKKICEILYDGTNVHDEFIENLSPKELCSFKYCPSIAPCLPIIERVLHLKICENT